MAYGAEVDGGVHSWEMRFTHSSGVQLMAAILNNGVDTQAVENTKDAIFQGLLNKIAELPNVTINSATKNSNYTSQVTSP